MTSLAHTIAARVFSSVAAKRKISAPENWYLSKRVDLRDGQRFAAFVLSRRLGVGVGVIAEVMGRSASTIENWLSAMDARARQLRVVADEATRISAAIRREILESDSISDFAKQKGKGAAAVVASVGTETSRGPFDTRSRKHGATDVQKRRQVFVSSV